MRLAVSLALAALLLSGCFAPAPGRIEAGDPVMVRVAGHTLDGEEVYPEATMTVTGNATDTGPLAVRLPQELAGRVLGRSFSFVVTGDDHPGRMVLSRIQPSVPAEPTVPANQVPGAQVGATITRQGLNYTVLQVANDTVRLRAAIGPEGLREDYPQLGLALVHRIQGAFVQSTLEVTEQGKTFRAPEDVPFRAHGRYRIEGIQGDLVVMGYNPFPDQSVRYTVRVQAQGPAVGEDGNYIARTSPGAPGNLTADDGHDHTH